jgi:hypothetical protein
MIRGLSEAVVRVQTEQSVIRTRCRYMREREVTAVGSRS